MLLCVSVHIAKGGAVYQQMCAQTNHGLCIQWASLYLRNGTMTLALQMNFENSWSKSHRRGWVSYSFVDKFLEVESLVEVCQRLGRGH